MRGSRAPLGGGDPAAAVFFFGRWRRGGRRRFRGRRRSRRFGRGRRRGLRGRAGGRLGRRLGGSVGTVVTVEVVPLSPLSAITTIAITRPTITAIRPATSRRMLPCGLLVVGLAHHPGRVLVHGLTPPVRVSRRVSRACPRCRIRFAAAARSPRGCCPRPPSGWRAGVRRPSPSAGPGTALRLGTPPRPASGGSRGAAPTGGSSSSASARRRSATIRSARALASWSWRRACSSASSITFDAACSAASTIAARRSAVLLVRARGSRVAFPCSSRRVA